MLRAALIDRVFVSSAVIIPEFAVLPVADRQLPEFFLILFAGQQALFLFVPADVQVKLQHDRVIVSQQFLEVVDVIVAGFPGFFPGQFQHTRDQHIFVMRAIEDADVSSFRRLLMHPPQKIMREFPARRHLE